MLYDVCIVMQQGNIRVYFDKCHVSLNERGIIISYDKPVACYLLAEIETLSICNTTK